MDGVIDKFGLDFKSERIDDKIFLAHVKVCPSPAFYAWVFQWGGKVKIISPKTVKDEFLKMINTMND